MITICKETASPWGNILEILKDFHERDKLRPIVCDRIASCLPPILKNSNINHDIETDCHAKEVLQKFSYKGMRRECHFYFVMWKWRNEFGITHADVFRTERWSNMVYIHRFSLPAVLRTKKAWIVVIIMHGAVLGKYKQLQMYYIRVSNVWYLRLTVYKICNSKFCLAFGNQKYAKLAMTFYKFFSFEQEEAEAGFISRIILYLWSMSYPITQLHTFSPHHTQKMMTKPWILRKEKKILI